jgi:hypothetical protein
VTRGEARTQHWTNLLAAATGLAYAGFKYFASGKDPYSAAGSPWEPAAHSFHVILSPPLIFAVGLIWRDHVLRKLRHFRRRGRFSGLALVALFMPMVVSAYLIQVTVEETWRKAWVILHLATAALWVSSYLGHLLMRPADKRPSDKKRERISPLPLKLLKLFS